MSSLTLRTQDGLAIRVPASLGVITTYVLLEQERWFEDETAFVLRCLQPGEQAVDVGANFGLYSSAMARAAGPTGRVFAFEPAGKTATLLRETVALQGTAGITVIQAALSDRAGRGELTTGQAPETHALRTNDATPGPHETVELLTLDESLSSQGAGRIALLKLDAEGHELAVVRGAQRTLREHDPLVLFEIKAGPGIDLALADHFLAAGMQLYRLVPGLQLLAPWHRDEPLDPFQLNLFACSPRRAAMLEARGLLACQRVGGQTPGAPSREPLLFANLAFQSPLYESAVEIHRAAQCLDAPAATRFALLEQAYARAHQACSELSSLSRLATLVRCALDLGHRTHAVKLLSQITRAIVGAEARFSEPSLALRAPSAGMSVARLEERLPLSLFETLELSRSYSTCFMPPAQGLPLLDYICSQPGAMVEMHRRRELLRRRCGSTAAPEPILNIPAGDNLNAGCWTDPTLRPG